MYSNHFPPLNIQNTSSRTLLSSYLAQLNSLFLFEDKFYQLCTEKSLFLNSNPLRHPLIFYYCHTATFYINKLNLSGIINYFLNERFETMFAVGVDENAWDDTNFQHYDWPSYREVYMYK